MQRRTDELLGDVRAVGLGGVDEVDAELDRAAQGRYGTRAVLRRAPGTRAGDLHGAVAEPGDPQLAADPEGPASRVFRTLNGHGRPLGDAECLGILDFGSVRRRLWRCVLCQRYK